MRRMEGPRTKRFKTETSDKHGSDEFYFASYDRIGIHEEMLRDRIRTEAYRDAIAANASSFKGKTVLDVGCGSGILSLFCAQHGASKVYAVDASEMASQAEKVVKSLGFENTIEVFHGKVEDISLEPQSVDIIVSEWMGYFLVYESMLPSVLTARDKFLKKGGFMFPSIARLYAAPLNHDDFYEDRIKFWEDVYGFDMSALIPFAKKCAFEEPVIEPVGPENVMARPCTVKEFDISTVSAMDASIFSGSLNFRSMVRAPCHGLVAWFDVVFTARCEGAKDIVLSTSPDLGITHWQQTLLFFDDPFDIEQDEYLDGTMVVTPNEGNPRFTDIAIQLTMGKGTSRERNVSKYTSMRN